MDVLNKVVHRNNRRT